MTGFDFAGDNDAIRAEVVRRLNAVPGTGASSARFFPRSARRADHLRDVRRAIAEFEFSQTFADAPIDRFARGDTPR